MSGTFSRERAAAILAECDFFDARNVAERWKISERTICNYRSRLAEDRELSDLFLAKKKELAEQWRDNATRTLTVALDRLRERIPQAQTKTDCDLIYSLSGCVKIVGDLVLASAALLDDDLPAK